MELYKMERALQREVRPPLTPEQRESLRRKRAAATQKRKEAELKRLEDLKREAEEKRKLDERQCMFRKHCWAYNKSRDKETSDYLMGAAALMVEEFLSHPDIATLTKEKMTAWCVTTRDKYIRDYTFKMQNAEAEQPRQAPAQPQQTTPVPKPPWKPRPKRLSPWL
jgi:hypothetical protein